jgi:hypothetical protein
LVGGGDAHAPPRLPPLLLCYICTSLFVLYIPIVGATRWLGERRKERGDAAASAGAHDAATTSSGGTQADGSITIPLLQGANLPPHQEQLRQLSSGKLLAAALAVGPTWFCAQLAFAW